MTAADLQPYVSFSYNGLDLSEHEENNNQRVIG